MSNSPLKQKKGISVAGFNITNPQGSKKSQIVHDAVSTFDFNSDNKISTLEGIAGGVTSLLGGAAIKSIGGKLLPRIFKKLRGFTKTNSYISTRTKGVVENWKTTPKKGGDQLKKQLNKISNAEIKSKNDPRYKMGPDRTFSDRKGDGSLRVDPK